MGERELPTLKEIKQLELKNEELLKRPDIHGEGFHFLMYTILYCLVGSLFYIANMPYGYASINAILSDPLLRTTYSRICSVGIFLFSVTYGISYLLIEHEGIESLKLLASHKISRLKSFFFLAPFIYYVFVIYIMAIIADITPITYYDATFYASMPFFVAFGIGASLFAQFPYEYSFNRIKSFLLDIYEIMEKNGCDFKEIDDSHLREGLRSIDDSELVEGLKSFNNMLSEDRLRLNIELIRDYIRLLKWFGTEEERKSLIIHLFEILKAFKNLNEPKIGDILSEFGKEFEIKKENTKIAEKRPTIEQRCWDFFIKNWQKSWPIVFSFIGSIALIIRLILEYIHP